MEIVNIFAIVNNSLLAVQFKGENSDEFDLLFENWKDIEYLEKFFEENKNDLQNGFYGNITVEEAVFRTLDEASKLEAYIKEIAKNGHIDSKNTLQDLIFRPLSENDTSINLTKSKAYGQTNPFWLRLYAIRIASNLYVVSGGGIKLTKTMQERPHLKHELKKLEATAEHLKEEGFLNENDYDFIEISSHDKR